jgi:predicted CopG family antitoxin
MGIRSVGFNKKEEEQLVSVLDGKSFSSVVKTLLFEKRKRTKIDLHPVDLVFLSELSTMVSSILDDYGRGQDVTLELKDLQTLVNNRLG